MTNPAIYSATAPSGPWPPPEDASLHSSLPSACLLHPRIPRTYSASLLATSFFCLSFPALAPLRFSRHTLFFLTGWDLFHNQPPTRRTRVPLFVGVIAFDLSYLASSCSSADIALLIIWPRRFHHYAIPCRNSNRIPACQRVSRPRGVLCWVQSINKWTDIGPLFDSVTLFWLYLEPVRVFSVSIYWSRITVRGQR